MAEQLIGWVTTEKTGREPRAHTEDASTGCNASLRATSVHGAGRGVRWRTTPQRKDFSCLLRSTNSVLTKVLTCTPTINAPLYHQPAGASKHTHPHTPTHLHAYTRTRVHTDTYDSLPPSGTFSGMHMRSNPSLHNSFSMHRFSMS